ncbi:4285_t:CDS:1 [Acaulospora morrowiae]|uniref:4285_t:CDS:1 n=1 Tax=Acaulospora morrowiae TaxID=94023 RepID=A0A9N9FGB6_9GLOM|nr:4285_t:CDS:1 [Acaulospora morrowiae]
MGIPILTDDTICEILQHLHYDTHTLYNCLFVNRFWCSNVVSILWRHPFTNSYKPFTSGKHKLRRSLIIRTYVSCLNDEELARLIPFSIDFSYTKKPLFPYERYLQELSDSNIDKGVRNWIQSQGKDVLPIYQADKRAIAIIDSLWHMFMRQCIKIKSVSITPLYINSGLLNATNILHASSAFAHLNNFYFRIDWSRSEEIKYKSIVQLLKQLISLSDNINHMELSIHERINPNIMKYIVKLINVQRGIKKFIFHDSRLLRSITAPITTSITTPMVALQSQANCLVSLEFHGVKFDDVSVASLAGFDLLESLLFQKCRDITLERMEILSQASFHIKFLSMQKNLWPSIITSVLIAKAGESLRQIVLDDVSTETIQAMTNCCPNINVAYISPTDLTYQLIFPWVGSTSLKKLEISFETHARRGIQIPIEDSSKVMQLLGETLSTSLVFLKLNGLRITNEAFNYFMESCCSPLSTLFISHGCYLELESCVWIIVKFAFTHKTLKTYGSYSLKKSAHQNFLEILAKNKIQVFDKYNIRSLIYKDF